MLGGSTFKEWEQVGVILSAGERLPGIVEPLFLSDFLFEGVISSSSHTFPLSRRALGRDVPH